MYVMASESSKRAFSKFLEFCRSATEDDSEVLKLLQKRFNKTSHTYLNSEAFFSLLHRTSEQIKNDSSRKFVYIKEFISELRAYGEVHTKWERRNQDACSEPPSKKARVSEPVNHATREVSVKLSSSESLCPNSTLCSGKPKLTEKETTAVTFIDKPSGSRALPDEQDTLNLSNSQVFLRTLGLSPKVLLADCRSSVKTAAFINQSGVLDEKSSAEKRQHKTGPHSSCLLDLTSGDSDLEKNSKKASEKQIEKLEVLLGKLRNEIERLEEIDLDLDELEQEDSNYILLDKYKAKFVKVWDKLCELKGRTPTTGRPVERRFRFEGTRYSVINKKVEKFINKHKIFPDYPDIHTIICYCNKKHNLKLRKKVLHELAKDVFTEVGNRLQKRRLEDFVSNFGSHLTDRYKAHDDPAFYDKQLRRRLDENQIESKSKLDEVINKYAAKQFAEDEPTSGEEDEEEDNDDDSQGNCMNDEHAFDTEPDDDDAEDKDDFDEEDQEMEVNGEGLGNQGNEASKECGSLSSSLQRKHMFCSIFIRQNSGESSGVDIDDHSGDTPALCVQINRKQASDTVKDLIKEPVKRSIDDSTNRGQRRIETIRLLSPPQHKDGTSVPEETQMSSSSDGSSETAAANSSQSNVGSKEYSDSHGTFVIDSVYSLSGDGGLCDRKEGSILLGTSPTSHSSDKENIGSPLIHCDKLLQSDHNLASLSPDGGGPELPNMLTNDDDCIDMGTVVSSTASLTSENKRLKLSPNISVNRSDDGIKQASRALKAVLNKFGDAVRTKTTPSLTIELLSESSDGESAEDGKSEKSLGKVSAGGDGQLVAASITNSRNGKDEIKTTDDSSSLRFTADVHAEHKREHSNDSSSSVCSGKKTVDHEVPIADEDVMCSPAPKSCTENVDSFVDDKDDDSSLPSLESCDQKQNKEPSGSKTMENTQDEDHEVSVHDDQKSPYQKKAENHHADNLIRQVPCQEDAKSSDCKKNLPTNNPTTSVPSEHQAGCSAETSQASNKNGMIDASSQNNICLNSEVKDMKDDICLVNNKQTVDVTGESSHDAVISVDAVGNATLDSDDDCVMIMQVDMKHKRAAVKLEQPDATTVPTTSATNTVSSSLLNGFDLNSICSSVVSKVLQEKRQHPGNITSVPASSVNMGSGCQYVTSTLLQHVTKNRQSVTTTACAGNRLRPFLHRASNSQPSFQPVATSTPVKHQPLTMTMKGAVSNSACYGLGPNVLNQATSTASLVRLARSHRSHEPNVGSLYGRGGTVTLRTQGNQATKDLLIIKPVTQGQNTATIVGTTTNSNNINSHLVRTARRQRRRNQVQNSDIIVLSDSD